MSNNIYIHLFRIKEFYPLNLIKYLKVMASLNVFPFKYKVKILMLTILRFYLFI